MTSVRIGVIGAGAMGRGIAQLSCTAGFETVLHDAMPAALATASSTIRDGIDKLHIRGRLSDPDATFALLSATDDFDQLARCDLVIEAVPEHLPVKLEVMARLSAIVSHECVIATNTSSLRVAAIAQGVEGPHRFLGLHFFNPVPLMRLIELVPGPDTDARSLGLVREITAAMGHTVIQTADVIGFVVNRCGRPFTLEAQRLLEDGVADVPVIDRICRESAGFRMGPFELLDLVGLDVAVDVATSFYAQSFGEPRWRPSQVSVGLLAAGRLGRKSGRGFFEYPSAPVEAAPHDPPAQFAGTVCVLGIGPIADGIRAGAARAAVGVVTEADQATLIIDCGLEPTPRDTATAGTSWLTLCVSSLAARDTHGAVGFFVPGPLAEGQLVELTQIASSTNESVADALAFFASLGSAVLWVNDSPGLVTGRIVSQLVNEASFALSAGVATADDIDNGMRLGLNYPSGPLAWGELIGIDTVVAVLTSMLSERGDERYHVAPLLRALQLQGTKTFAR